MSPECDLVGVFKLSMKYQHVTCQYNILSKYLIHVHVTRVGGCDVAMCDVDAYVCRVYYDICVTDPGTTVGVNTYATDPT